MVNGEPEVDDCTAAFAALRFSECIERCLAVLGRDPLCFEAQLLLGQALRSTYQSKRAAVEFERALELKPDSTEALGLRFDIALEFREHQRAREILNLILRSSAQDWFKCYALGCMYLADGRTEEGFVELEEVLSHVRPERADIVARVATEMRDAGRRDQAYDLLSPLRGTDRCVDEILIGLCISLRRRSEAEEIYRDLASRHPTYEILPFHEAKLCISGKQYRKAIALLEPLHDKFPAHTGVAMLLSLANTKAWRLARAYQIIKRVCDEQPWNEQARYIYGAVQLRRFRLVEVMKLATEKVRAEDLRERSSRRT